MNPYSSMDRALLVSLEACDVNTSSIGVHIVSARAEVACLMSGYAHALREGPLQGLGLRWFKRWSSIISLWWVLTAPVEATGPLSVEGEIIPPARATPHSRDCSMLPCHQGVLLHSVAKTWQQELVAS